MGAAHPGGAAGLTILALGFDSPCVHARVDKHAEIGYLLPMVSPATRQGESLNENSPKGEFLVH